MLDGLSMTKITAADVPEAGTLPVPNQPVHTCCTPVATDKGEATDVSTDAPASNHSSMGMDGLWGEIIVKEYLCFQMAVSLRGLSTVTRV